MTDGTSPKLNRRTLLTGTAAVATAAAGLGVGNYWLGSRRRVARSDVSSHPKGLVPKSLERLDIYPRALRPSGTRT